MVDYIVACPSDWEIIHSPWYDIRYGKLKSSKLHQESGFFYVSKSKHIIGTNLKYTSDSMFTSNVIVKKNVLVVIDGRPIKTRVAIVGLCGVVLKTELTYSQYAVWDM